MRGEEIILLSLAALSIGKGKKKEIKRVSTREDYELIWSPQLEIATGTEVVLTWKFVDLKKRYLRGISVVCRERVVDIEAYINKEAQASYRTNIHIIASPTHAMPGVTVRGTIVNWIGDLPMRGHLLISANNVVVGDQIRANIMYEEKKA